MKNIVLVATVFRIIIIAALLGFTIYATAQSVVVNTTGNLSASAMLNVSSTTKGFLAPVMSTAERIAVLLPATGLLVVGNNTKSFRYFPTRLLPWLRAWKDPLERCI